MPECGSHVWALREKEIAMFTRLLVLPSRHVGEFGWPSKKWLEKQEFKIENGLEGEGGRWYYLTKQLERDLSMIKQMRVILAEATGFQRDRILPPRADVCWVHRRLSPFIVHEVFECVVEEVTFKTDVMRNYRGTWQTASLVEFVDRISGINSLWLSEEEFDDTFCRHREGEHEEFPEADRFSPLLNAIPRRIRDKHGLRDRSKPRARRSCEACVLAFIGGRGSMLSDLRAHLLARSRVDKKRPRLLPFVEAWMGHFGGKRMKQLHLESQEMSKHIEVVLREARKHRRADRRRREARGSRGRARRADKDKQNEPDTQLAQARLGRLSESRRMTKTPTQWPRRNRESRNDFTDAVHYSDGNDDSNVGYEPAIPVASDPIVGGYAAEQERCTHAHDLSQSHRHGEDEYQQDEGSISSDEDYYDGQYTQLGVNNFTSDPRNRDVVFGRSRPSESASCTTRSASDEQAYEDVEEDDVVEDDEGQYVGPRSHWRQPSPKEEEDAAADEDTEHDESWDVRTRLREWSSRRQLRSEAVQSSYGTKLALGYTDACQAPTCEASNGRACEASSSNRTVTNLSAIVPPLKLRETRRASDAGWNEADGYESDSWQSASVATWITRDDRGREPESMDIPPVPRIRSIYKQRFPSKSQDSIDRNSFYQLQGSSSSIYSGDDTASIASSLTVYTRVKQSTHVPVAFFKDPFAEGQRTSDCARSILSEVSVRTPAPRRNKCQVP